MQSDEQAIRDLVATWIRASKAGDTKTVLGLMTDDVVFLQPAQPPMLGKAAFAAASAAHAKHGPVEFDGTSEIQEIRICGDLAYLWTRLTVRIVPSADAPAVLRRGNTLSILKKVAGRWLLHRDANLLTVVPE